ncbi:MAG: hypothetical protein AABY89_11685 [Acidobacteriota bacterium]
MKTKRAAGLPNVPWITAEGTFDPAKFPIDSTLRQCVSSNFNEFRSGCRFLNTMVDHGRVEAGVFLLGLLRYFEDDLNVLGVVVESLVAFQNAPCAAALFAELRRVRSSNTTRRYLDSVIKTLARFPTDVVRESFWRLAGDSAFSPKMRAKFKAAAEGGRDSW